MYSKIRCVNNGELFLLKNFAVGLNLVLFSKIISRSEAVALAVHVADVLEDLVHGAQVVPLDLHIVG
jgi:hypothetical protein